MHIIVIFRDFFEQIDKFRSKANASPFDCDLPPEH